MLIQTIVVRSHDTSYGGFPWVCEVVVKLDSKAWTKLRTKGQLGQLYGVDISNEVYKLTNQLVPAYNPTVSDRDRAKNGIKTIRLSYYFKDHDAAEALGCEVKRFKSGDIVPAFGACAVVYDARRLSKLTLVGAQ